jgi:hypothetical protein
MLDTFYPMRIRDLLLDSIALAAIFVAALVIYLM